MQKLKTVTAKSERKKAVEQLNVIDRTRLQIPSFDEMDNGYKRLKYVRYADDFLIGVIGSKEDCQRIKEDIKNFLESELKLEFSDEKTLITHSQKAAKFLGYAVLANRSNLAKRDNTGRLSRVYNKKVLLRISMETIKKKLLDFGVLEVKTHNGKEHWKPREHRKIICNDNLEILQKYNYTIRGFHNYYAIANNSSLLNSYKYIMEYSMYKTFAGKYKSKVSKIARKYKQDGLFTVQYQGSKGREKQQTFYNESFSRRKT